MKQINKITKQAFFLIRSLLLFTLLYLIFFAIGAAVFICGYLLAKFKLTHGYLPYDLPSILPVILLLSPLLLFGKMIGSLSAIQTVNRPDLKEITENDQPRLFRLINEVSTHLHIVPPSKIYLSATVSAAIFLETGFWNVFFRPKKKLEIGIGLLNILNQDELRAVLAHEMGHFSQTATWLNKPVYAIGQGVRYLVKKIEIKRRGTMEEQYYVFAYAFRLLSEILFSRLSKDFDLLSEEMEYDADRIAAGYAGKEAVVSALLKITFASQMFNHTLNSINILACSKKGIADFYSAQNCVTSIILQANNTKWENEFINIPLPESRLSALTKKRICKLQKLKTKTIDFQATSSANNLLNNFAAESTQFSECIYRHQLKTQLSSLDICPLSKYHKWVEKYFNQLTIVENSHKEVMVEIVLQSKMHCLPLINSTFYVNWNDKRVGVGWYKKGVSLKVYTSLGKHTLKIEGIYIKDLSFPVSFDNKRKHIIYLDYKYSFRKGEYSFFIKEIKNLP